MRQSKINIIATNIAIKNEDVYNLLKKSIILFIIINENSKYNMKDSIK
jgi:hypothetical protein